MSKNAIVLDDHFGDDGSVTAGVILKDMSTARFNELEKKGLVREATAAELKAGTQRSIDADPSKDAGGEKEGKTPDNKQAADPKNKGA